MELSIITALYKSDYESLLRYFSETSVDRALNTNLIRPLHLAVKLKNKDLIKFLVNDLSADVNITDINGWTPLGHIAVEGDFSKHEIAQLLIFLGADVDFSTRESGYFSAYQLARDNRDSAPEIYDLLYKFTKNTKWNKRRPIIYLIECYKRTLI